MLYRRKLIEILRRTLIANCDNMKWALITKYQSELYQIDQVPTVLN